MNQKTYEKIMAAYSEFAKKFADDISELFAPRLKDDEDFALELVTTLKNGSWQHKDDPGKNEYSADQSKAWYLLEEKKYGKLFDTAQNDTANNEIIQAMKDRGWEYTYNKDKPPVPMDGGPDEWA